MAEIFLDGLGPLPLVTPASVAEVGSLVQQAAGDGFALYPVGGRTQLHLGCSPTKKGQVVDLCALDQVIDYPARDMTITVQAGMRIANLQAILAKENQRLPIDVPQAEQATLGGILAANTSGPRRLGYGTLRDYLLGFSAVNDLGQETRAGGRVVKNVAGYDLCKLFVGSLGSLGIITQATIKLRPIPEEQALITLGCESSQLEKTLLQLHGTRTRPVFLDLLNRTAGEVLSQKTGLELPQTSWILLVGIEGNEAAVHWQVQQLVRELGPAATLQARLGCTAQQHCQALFDLPGSNAILSLKANILPSGLAAFCAGLEDLPHRPLLQSHAGNGIVLGHYLDGLALEQAGTIIKTWRELAGKFQGRAMVTRCPPAWKTPQFVWGTPAGDTWLMREVKARLDPQNLFNPGRFVDGI